jgi:6-phosphofructokinase 1
MPDISHIGVITPGGDAPGMNAAIRSVVRVGLSHKCAVTGVCRGFWGLINEELRSLDHRAVSGIINMGGTILKTTRCAQFATPEGQERAYATIKKHSIDGLILIGGNGTFAAAHSFYQRYQVPCIGIPASIDNDINGIEETIGTDTAMNTALMAIDNIRDTATSMERVFVVEVMGRDSGYLAMQVALAGGCENVLIPEVPFDLNVICHDIVNGNIRGKVSWIIVVAEGAGDAAEIARRITDITSLETRAVILGHVQRGGRPTAHSRNLGLLLGEAAVECLRNRQTDKAVSLTGGRIETVDFAQAVSRKVFIPDGLLGLIKKLS